jgi:molybdate transport system substrate-binding protein
MNARGAGARGTGAQGAVARRTALLLLATLAWHGAAHAAELALLSAGAVEPGIKPVVAAYEAASGDRVRITFAAAPQIEERLARGERFDVVIAPLAVLDAAQRAGRIGGERVGVGQVGIGVAIRADAPVVPGIADAEAVKRELLGAEAVIYNRASTGRAVEGILRELGIAAQVDGRAERPADGAAVMERLRRGHGREIGLGAITEILLFKDHGVRYVGPLPAPLQRFTVYAAALPAAAMQPDAARRLFAHLSSAASKASFAAAGVDPPPPR